MLPSIIGFPASSDEFVESKQLDHEGNNKFSSLCQTFL